jgi:hypothetical protein
MKKIATKPSELQRFFRRWPGSQPYHFPATFRPASITGRLAGRLLFGGYLFIGAGYIDAFAAFAVAWAITYLGIELSTICRRLR